MARHQKVKTRKISWKAVVNKADPERNRRKVAYVFSGGRKFYDKGR